MRKLNYVILNPRSEVSLNLYEAEKYEPAIVVQSLIGNLIYYSNHGRYETRLAKAWFHDRPNLWEFELHDSLRAQNGEKIDAQTFKASIKRTLKFLSKRQPFPVLMNLRGYSSFVSGRNKDLEGLRAEGNRLVFEFDQPVRDGLLQVLSFAPFGYISKDNLNEDGSWKNQWEFVSSGPYKIAAIDKGRKIVLERNQYWTRPVVEGAPEIIEFTFAMPDRVYDPMIVDAFMTKIEPPIGMSKYSLVPEYINPVLLGNLENGYFSDINVRRQFKKLLESHRDALPEQWDVHTRSQSFYPNQNLNRTSEPMDPIVRFPKSSDALIIEGSEPEMSSPRAMTWKILSETLKEAGLSFRFQNNEANMSNITAQNFDLRIRGASIGGGVEAWGLKILFCSELGPKFPDPNGQICNLLDRYEEGEVADQELSTRFHRYIEDASAIVPISHYGIQLYLSESIDSDSISPTLSIMRFDMLGIRK